MVVIFQTVHSSFAFCSTLPSSRQHSFILICLRICLDSNTLPRPCVCLGHPLLLLKKSTSGPELPRLLPLLTPSLSIPCSCFIASFNSMAAIQTLLNPLPEVDDRSIQLPSPCSTIYARDFSPESPSRKKQKLSKDAAVFTRGALRGECRYPPCEYLDDVLTAHYQQYEIHPIGHIAEFPRHIPYNSEKKSFLKKTGRESFEGKPLQIFHSYHMLIHSSVPVQLQSSWRREDLLHDVGL